MNQPWPQFDNPRGMLQCVRGVTQGRPEFDRLLRLFACAAARVVWIYVPGGACRRAVEVAEAFADGTATADALDPARAAAERQAVIAVRGRPSAGWGAAYTAQTLASDAASQTVGEVLNLFPTDQQQTAHNARALGHLLADLFGPYVESPGTTPDDPPGAVLAVRAFADDHQVRSAATQIYQENDFGELRLFGERLRAAGCRDSRVIDHCCGGRHARGSWVIDAVLVGWPLPTA